ncbi:MAG TPA: hypothetical protein VFS00_27710, partial [Polyangiaceae bacterium]|nr:hypothetical protein [Polyangiaceae bacterium]
MALDPPDLLARAGDHAVPGDELARLAAPLLAPARLRARAPHDVAALAALASNPNAPPELLFSLAPAYAPQVASNPALVLLLLENPALLVNAPFTALRSLLARPELPLEWLEQGARHSNYHLRFVAAESRRLAPSTLRLLANDPHV